MNILIVEDETELAQAMASFLETSNFRCDLAYTFDQASEKIHVYHYACVVVDIMLPDGNGLDLVRSLKQIHSPSGVIIVSAKNALDDRLSGLDIGADDYLTKPFHLPELAARINAILRRRQFKGQQELDLGTLHVAPGPRRASIKGTELDLTGKEFDLLLYLMANLDRTLTREAIAEHLLGEHADMLNSFDFIYTHVKNLRKKLVEAGGQDYIHTVYSIGYRFGKNEAAEET